MRARVLAFLVLAVPALLWAPVHAWAFARVAGWPAVPIELTFGERLILVVDNWATRWAPLLVLCATFASPFLGYLASRLARCSPAEARGALAVWFMTAVVLDLAPGAAGRVAWEYRVWTEWPLEWASLVAGALATGCAVVALRAHRPAHMGWNGSSLLWSGVFVLVLLGAAPLAWLYDWSAKAA